LPTFDGVATITLPDSGTYQNVACIGIDSYAERLYIGQNGGPSNKPPARILVYNTKNHGTAHLVGSINSGESIWTVDDATTLPPQPFVAALGKEIVYVATTSGNQLSSIVRDESTTNTDHANNTVIHTPVTAGKIDLVRADTFRAGDTDEMPGPEKAGRLFLAEDQLYLNRDAGGLLAAVHIKHGEWLSRGRGATE
jgi:hypothetical protein